MVLQDPVESAVAQDGVGTESNVHIEGDVVTGGHRCDVLKDLLGALTAAELLGIGINHWGGGTNRGCGVQLVRLEDNLNRLCDALLSQLGDGIVKTALSYKAPWAHNVGPDFYAHKCNDR